MHSHYENPLTSRYASAEMSELWSAQRKHSTWRQLWVWLAEAEADLGLPVTREQIAELSAHIDDIDFAAADRYERELRHDVMPTSTPTAINVPLRGRLFTWGRPVNSSTATPS